MLGLGAVATMLGTSHSGNPAPSKNIVFGFPTCCTNHRTNCCSKGRQKNN